MTEPSILIASDSFKGSASSFRVAELIEQGIRRVLPRAGVKRLAIADGGEGTVDAVIAARNGEIREVDVLGPLGDTVCARYGLFGRDCAIIEMAEAAGITLVEQNRSNALLASSYGVGQLIVDALDAGVRHIYVGLGGSATSDGGSGMAKALGARFLNADGEDVAPGLAGLRDLARIDLAGLDPRLADTEIVAITDVTNPLTGPSGAVAMYGPQKGIDVRDVASADSWMRSYARMLEAICGRDIDAVPGAGAAGGLGAALTAFCGARVERGIEFVLDAIHIDEALEGVDLVVTGEGHMDAQSAFGKAPVGVARRAKARGIPVVAVVGARAEDLGEVYESGIDLVVPAVIGPATLEECMADAATLLPIAGESVARAFLLGTRARRVARP